MDKANKSDKNTHSDTPSSNDLITVNLLFDSELKKGGKKAAIGDFRVWSGKRYVKTINGWEYSPENTAPKPAQNEPALNISQEPSTLAPNISPEPSTLDPNISPEPSTLEVESPRQEAEESQVEAKEEYVNARESAISNMGKDLKGAARHKRQFSTIKSMETAELSEITLKTLQKQFPINLIDDVTLDNPIIPYVANQILDRYPAKPKHDVQKEMYLSTFEFVRNRVQELSKQKHLLFTEIIATVQKEVTNKIKENRASPSYVRGSDDFLVPYVNNTLSNRLTRGSVGQDISDLVEGFASTLPQDVKDANTVHPTYISKELKQLAMREFYTESGVLKIKDLIEGKAFSKVFEQTAEGDKRKKFSIASVYTQSAKRTGPETDLDTVEKQAEFMTKSCEMKGLQWGNTVTDDERKHHLKMSSEAFKDLADILQLPIKMISFNGRLGLAIGARGHGTALAHYEPAEVVINLTRAKGVGSLAHEWGHFLDNTLAKTHNVNAHADNTYLSEAAKFRMGSDSPVKSAMAELVNSKAWHDFKTTTMEALKDLAAMGIKEKSSYWLSPREMFARSFEGYISHKLEGAGRENTYLSGGSEGLMWCNKEQKKAFEPLFDKLMAAFRESEHIKKAMDLMDEQFEALDKGQNGDWQKEGYTISHELADRTKRNPLHGDEFGVFAYHKGKVVGSAYFRHHGSYIQALDDDGLPSVSISPDHQRKGLASGLYSYAQRVSGSSVIPSEGRTDEGKAFWSNPNRPFGKSESFEELEKSKKDMQNMLGPDLTPEHQEHIKWASKLPNSNWQVWATKAYKNNPDDFKAKKQDIEHFAGSQHIPEVANHRFEKQHDLDSGLDSLKSAEKQYQDKLLNNTNVLKPSKTTKQLTNIPGKTNWYGLAKPSCEAEGKAMGHCGNAGNPDDQDRILSLRTKHEINGKEYHEPHVTFISNNGYLGEMKGRSNEKPAKHYHQHIVELLKSPNVKGIFGGGYKPEANFAFSDLSSQHQKEVLDANPNLITDTKSNENIDKILNADLPDKYGEVIQDIAENEHLDPKHLDKLIDSPWWSVQGILARRPDLNLRHQAIIVDNPHTYIKNRLAQNPVLDPQFHEKLINEDNWNISASMAARPDLDPKHHKRLMNSGYAKNVLAIRPDLSIEHQRQLVNDLMWNVRADIAGNEHLDPQFHEQLIDDPTAQVKYAIAGNKNLDPKYYDKFIGHHDPTVRSNVASQLKLTSEQRKTLSGDDNVYVRSELARHPNLDQQDRDNLLARPDLAVVDVLSRHPNLSDSDIHKILKYGDDGSRESIAQRGDLNSIHHDTLVNSKNQNIREIMALRDDLDHKHLDTLSNDKYPLVKEAALQTIAKRNKLAASEPLYKAPIVDESYSDVNFPDPRGNDDLHEDYNAKYINSKVHKPTGTVVHRFDLPDFGHFYGITDNNKPDGNLISKLEVNNESPGEHLPYISLVHTHPQHQGKGYGTTLHYAALADYKELASDWRLSPASHHIWKKMSKHPGINVQLEGKRVDDGIWDPQFNNDPDFTQHVATLKRSESFIVQLCLLEDNQLLKSDYFKPTGLNQVHPDKGYISGEFHNQHVWYSNPDTQNKHDSRLNDQDLINKFTSKMPTIQHKKAFQAIVNKVKNDKYRHAIPSFDHVANRHQLRARHLNALLLGDNNYIINTSRPNQMSITALQRHGTDTSPTEFKYDIKEVPHDPKISKSYDESGAGEFVADLWRSESDIDGRGPTDSNVDIEGRNTSKHSSRRDNRNRVDLSDLGILRSDFLNVDKLKKLHSSKFNVSGLGLKFSDYDSTQDYYKAVLAAKKIHDNQFKVEDYKHLADEDDCIDTDGYNKHVENLDKDMEDFRDFRSSFVGPGMELAMSETLEKSKKDMQNMLGPDLTPEHQEHIKWAAKLPNSNWQVWATKAYKNNPDDFKAKKQDIEHFAGSQHIPEVANIRFEKQHDLDSGLDALKSAEKQYQDKLLNNTNVLKPSKITKQLTNIPGKTNWYGLSKPSCEAEGKAMGHCGNAGNPDDQDRILSLRTKHEINGKEYHEPHVTFISNNGYLGEMKGRSNEKPAKHYHQHIVELLKSPNVKGIFGGGYKPEANFQFSDLSPEHQKEVLDANPNLITDTKSNENIDKILNNELPEKFEAIKEAIAKNPNLDPKHHEKLVNDEDWYIREAIASHPNLDPKHHEKLVNDEDWTVREAIASNPNLDPKHHEKLVNDEYSNVREAIASHPNLDPKHHEKLVNDEYSNVREAARKALETRSQKLAASEAIFKSENTPITVTPNSGKLREIRHLINQQPNQSIHKKELEKLGYNLKSLNLTQHINPNGTINSNSISHAIDSLPKHQFHISTSKYDEPEGQQHSNEPQDIFQLNITPDHEKAMHQAGVYDTFQNMIRGSQESGHPVGPRTIGWVRHTTGKDGNTHIDEVQSDLSKSFLDYGINQVNQAMTKEGFNANGQIIKFTKQQGKQHIAKLQEMFPNEHFNKINEILFKGHTPNDMLHEAFLQHQRDNGKADSQIHIWDTSSKAKLSNQDLSKELPVHMQQTYKQSLPKLGYNTESQYGAINTQSNEALKGSPTHAQTLRKAETLLKLLNVAKTLKTLTNLKK